jgi:pimeloyl-ACP methyl ester carboxylesterase
MSGRRFGHTRQVLRRMFARVALSAPSPPVPPPLPEGRILELPGIGETFVRVHLPRGPVAADAPTLVLLHGWTASADLQWFTAYKHLGESYPFVAIDHRGHGRGIRSEEPFTLEAAADDAAAAIRALGITNVVAVGYSMGGPIAVLLWQRHRDLVKGLVLCATALEWSGTRAERLGWRAFLRTEGLMRSRLSRRLARRTIAWFARENPAILPWTPWLGAELRRGDPSAFVEAGRALSQYDARPFAHEVDVPTAVVLTMQDQLVGPAKQRVLAAAMRAHIVELAGDHLVNLADGDRFAAAVRAGVDAVVVPSSVGLIGSVEATLESLNGGGEPVEVLGEIVDSDHVG